MSKFNTEMICLECEEAEREDPRYEEACQAELEACRRGDFNFPGIGRRRKMVDYTGIPSIDSLLANAKEYRNRLGNSKRETFLEGESRYLFDTDLDLEEWDQLDTKADAPYFGIWLNKTKLQTLSYIEGDLYFTQCKDSASYDAEVAVVCACHRPAPAFKAIDVTGKGTTSYYQDRLELFVDPERGAALMAAEEAKMKSADKGD